MGRQPKVLRKLEVELEWLPERYANTNTRMEKLGDGTFSRVLTKRGNSDWRSARPKEKRPEVTRSREVYFILWPHGPSSPIKAHGALFRRMLARHRDGCCNPDSDTFQHEIASKKTIGPPIWALGLLILGYLCHRSLRTKRGLRRIAIGEFPDRL